MYEVVRIYLIGDSKIQICGESCAVIHSLEFVALLFFIFFRLN